MTPSATAMDRAFDNDMAETIGFAASRLGSAIVSIATMRMKVR